MRLFSFVIVGLVTALVLPCHGAPKAINDLIAKQPEDSLPLQGVNEESYKDEPKDIDTRKEGDDENTDGDSDDDGEEVSELIVDASDYMDAKDVELIEDFDAWLFSLNKTGAKRQKRWVGIAVRVGAWAARAGARYLASRGGAAAIFRGVTRRYITRSGSRLTRHYLKSGSYRKALRDFTRLGPSNIKRITNSRFKGYTGTIGRGSGKYKMTVRSGSKHGSPTLEIRKGGVVRKFRYGPR